MIAMIGGVSSLCSGVSKKGNPWTGYFLQTVVKDARVRGFAADGRTFVEPSVYDTCLKKYVDNGGSFPLLANVDFDRSGSLLNLQLLDTKIDDFLQFYGLK